MTLALEAQDVTDVTDAAGFVTVVLDNADPVWWLVTPVTPNSGTHPFIAASADLVAPTTLKVKCYLRTAAPDDHSIASIANQTVRFHVVTFR